VTHLEGEIKELKEKVSWFRENQKLLSEDDDVAKTNSKEINELKM